MAYQELTTPELVHSAMRRDFDAGRVVRVYGGGPNTTRYIDWHDSGETLVSDVAYLLAGMARDGYILAREQSGQTCRYRFREPPITSASEFSFLNSLEADLYAWQNEVLVRRQRIGQAEQEYKQAEQQVASLKEKLVPPREAVTLEAIEKYCKNHPQIVGFTPPGGLFPVSETMVGRGIGIEFLPVLFDGSQLRDYALRPHTFGMSTPIQIVLNRNGQIGTSTTNHPHIRNGVCRGTGEDAMKVLVQENKPIEFLGFFATFTLGLEPTSMLNSDWPWYGWKALQLYNQIGRRHGPQMWDGETVVYSLTGEVGPIGRWIRDAETQEKRHALAQRQAEAANTRGRFNTFALGHEDPDCVVCGGKLIPCPCNHCSELHCVACGLPEGQCTCKRSSR